VLYPAAALFNARETFFNMSLVADLERRHGYRAYFPQRDGFEFGNLFKALQKVFPPATPASAIHAVIQVIIYYLDMGLFLPNSDVVVANMDEPLDEGVIVEVSYARLIGKPVIGVRSDVRTPFGNAGDLIGGIHFFPAFQSNEFLVVSLKGNSDLAGANNALVAISDTIHSRISNLVTECGAPLPEYARNNPVIAQLLEGADRLFHGLSIDDLNTDESVGIIVDRYMENRDCLKRLFPLVR
jgi:hypothetical protein